MTMKIAITSQNRRSVTEHAGHCRKFWVYDIEQRQVTGKTLLELPIEQSFHESSPHEPHPLDAVQVLIAGGMGPGLSHRLAAKGITALITPETRPRPGGGRLPAGRADGRGGFMRSWSPSASPSPSSATIHVPVLS